jgi:hypothetical protein
MNKRTQPFLSGMRRMGNYALVLFLTAVLLLAALPVRAQESKKITIDLDGVTL